ncbi:MAG TPA: alpha/beta hydrolase [Candidatus Sulfotelmatobacter sp.]|nr:alpha/beta hydrolase [Candidatus Sulfotelmatobacter sp.]
MASRAAGIIALVAVLLAACTRTSPTGATTPSAPGTPGAISWTACNSGFQCGTLAVPLDYAHPDGRKISLALIRKPATDSAQRIGSLLINFGGPGESGVQSLPDFGKSFATLNTRFDLVSWDSRGVGQSAPMHCVDGATEDAYLALDSVLDDPVEKQAAIAADKSFAAACQQSNGDTLPFMDTPSSARDLEQMRIALGDAKLSYLGFSYGTYLGQNYAKLFPTHIRALSLDGVVDPSVPANDSNLAQVVGFEQNLEAFLADCKKRTSCAYGRSGDPGTKLTALMARLDATPMTVGNRQMTRSIAMTGVLQLLYDQSYWPYLDQALSAVDRGDGRVLLYFADAYNGRNADGTYSSLFNGSYASTYCLDWPVPQDVASYDQLAAAFTKASPFFGPWSQYGNLQCAYWPAKPVRATGPINVTGAPPILLVGGTNDPATPYADSLSVNRQIEGSVLLTRQGNGHTSYLSSTCVAAAENAYLIDLKVPAAGTVCPS